jgi:hypothetical protein
MKRKLIIFGDSHVGSLRGGWGITLKNLASPPIEVEFYGRYGTNWHEFETTETASGLHFYADLVPNFDPVDFTVDNLDDVYVFCSPLHSAVILRGFGGQEYCPWTCAAITPGLQAVSTAVIETWAAAHMKCRFAMLKILKARGYHIAVAEPPKPVTRISDILAIDPCVIAEVDRIYRNFVVRWLKENDIPVIFVPEQTYADGFTPEEWAMPAATDGHHGSWKFGAEMMAKIIQFADAFQTAA